MAIINWKSQEEIDKEVEEANKPSEAELQVQSIRFAVQKLVRIDELSQEDISQLIMLYDKHEVDKDYKVGDILRYEGDIYRVVQGHKSQEDWKPNEVPALYTKIIPRGVIEEWGDRDLTVNPFMTGDKVIFEGKVWESLIDNNVWSPEEYEVGWKEAE